AIDDEPHRHGLDAPRRQTALDFFPEEWRQAVTDQAIEDASRLLGVDLLEVDLTRPLEGRLHRTLGDLVERHAVDVLLVDRQLLGEMPADRLAFPIRVGGHVEDLGPLGGLLEVVENLLLPGRHDVFRLEALLRIDAKRRFGQVSDVAHRRLHDELRIEILLNRLHLRRRLDDDEGSLTGRHEPLSPPGGRRPPPSAALRADGPTRPAPGRRAPPPPGPAVGRRPGSALLYGWARLASAAPTAVPPHCRCSVAQFRFQPLEGLEPRNATYPAILARHPPSS